MNEILKDEVKDQAVEKQNTEKNKDFSKIKFKFSSFDYKLLDLELQKIIKNCNLRHIDNYKIVMLPTKVISVTINKAHFIHKKSKDSYEMRIHNRLLIISSYKFDLMLLYGVKLHNIIDFTVERI